MSFKMKAIIFLLALSLTAPAFAGGKCTKDCKPEEPPPKVKLKDKDNNLIPWLMLGAVVGVSIAYSWDAREKGQEPVSMKFEALGEGGF